MKELNLTKAEADILIETVDIYRLIRDDGSKEDKINLQNAYEKLTTYAESLKRVARPR